MNEFGDTIIVTVRMLKKIIDELDDCPNIEMKTLGGNVWWDTICNVDGWRVQVNKITGHGRILDENDVRKAWGDANIMIEKLRRYKNGNFLLRGDILGVTRKYGLYEHYAVYVGNGEVIHYAAEGKDFGDKISVHKAPISEFLDNDKKFFLLSFKNQYGNPSKINVPQNIMNFQGIGNSVLMSNKSKLIKEVAYHLYTPEETARRAESRLGEEKYNLVTNNCEHFAIWCKTGISESYQVDRILDVILDERKVINYEQIANV